MTPKEHFEINWPLDEASFISIGIPLSFWRILKNSGAVCKISFGKIEKALKQTALKLAIKLELVSKELNHLAAIMHVYAGGLNFMK